MQLWGHLIMHKPTNHLNGWFFYYLKFEEDVCRKI